MDYVARMRTTSGLPLQRATIKDVARRAGVSIGTVSQAFNKPETVSKEAREAVILAAGELKYRPNSVARSLVARRHQAASVLRGDMPRLVTVGYLSIDFIVAVDGFPAPGGRVTSRFIDKMIGGPAANVASYAASLGEPLAVRTEIITRLGDDQDSIWAAEELARRGVDASGAEVTPGERVSRCIVLVDAKGERTIVNEPLQVPLELVTRHLAEQGRPKGLSCIHFDGFHLAAAESAEGPLHAEGHLLSFHAAGLDPLSQTALRAAEWLEMFDMMFLDRSAMDRIAASDPTGELLHHPERLFARANRPRCKAIMLTRGVDGAVLLRPSAPPLAMPAPKVRVTDVTGAGDAFTGIFLGSFLARGDLDLALKNAVTGASLSVTAYGAQGRLVTSTDLSVSTDEALIETL